MPDLSKGTMDQSTDSSLTVVERVSAQNDKMKLVSQSLDIFGEWKVDYYTHIISHMSKNIINVNRCEAFL